MPSPALVKRAIRACRLSPPQGGRMSPTLVARRSSQGEALLPSYAGLPAMFFLGAGADVGGCTV